MEPTIGFIGLGTMGGPMARRLASAGYCVTGYDRRSEAMAACPEVAPADSALACAAAADILLTSLPRPDHVESLMREEGVFTALTAKQIWVDLTTNRRDTLIAWSAETPASIVDCPVTGAVDGARNGKLTLFAGGENDDLDSIEPILSHLGRVIRCGELGTGTVTKLVTNQLWFIHAAALGEGFALGMRYGVELETLWDAIKDSVADSFVARHDAPSIFAGHYDPSFPLDLCVKDLGLIEELQPLIGADLPLTDSARDVFQRAGARYGLAAGEMHVAKQIEEDAELSFQLNREWTPHWEA